MSLAVTNSISTLLKQRQGCDSWNLYLDKFSFQRDGEPEAKTESLNKAINCYTSKSTSHLSSAMQSTCGWLAALKKQHSTRFRSVLLYNQSPLILHIGRASVLENVGIYCDRSTGLPVIPGSGIKGVLSTWATWEANQNDDLSFPAPDKWIVQRKDYMSDYGRRIFGCDSSAGSEHAGDLIFVGAYPKNLPVLGLDLVNPHHDEIGNVKIRLTPSAFLCIQPGTQWEFVFYARPGTTDAVTLLDTTERWLRECLEQLGLGAKTAAGYGRFSVSSPFSDYSSASGNSPSQEDLERKAKDLDYLKSDFPNEQTFKSTILDKLTPGALAQLEKEIPLLRKPENVEYLEKLTIILATRDYKDVRKRLRDKTWFPQEWLPTL